MMMAASSGVAVRRLVAVWTERRVADGIVSRLKGHGSGFAMHRSAARIFSKVKQ
jgi:hypothetical protein